MESSNTAPLPSQQPQEVPPLLQLIKQKAEALKHFILLVKVQNPPIRQQVAVLIRKEVTLKYLNDNAQTEQSYQTLQQAAHKLEQDKQVTEQQIQDRIAELNNDDNQSNWTDATESIAADDQDEIWMVDDDIIAAMDEGSEAEEEPQNQQQLQKQQKLQTDVNIQQLQQQFVKGKQSNEDWKVGVHQKFCTSVNATSNGKVIFSGGGDDRLLCFRQQNGKWQEFYRYKHQQTVTKIQVSNDDKYVVSLTEQQIVCTDLSNLQSSKLDVEEPTDMLCHRQGSVLVAAHSYSVSIFNLKNLSLFSTYCLDLPPSMITLTDSGKQIVAACDNKIRIITPKSNQISKVGGADFHKEQISSLVTGGNIIVSGCIEGKLYSSNISKSSIMGTMDAFKGAINCLCLADNYVMVAPQGDGVHWVDLNKMKRVFHNPVDLSVSDIVQVHSANHYAISNLQGEIYFIDRRNPMTVISKVEAGNTVHSLASKGSEVYAACQDGYVRVFDLVKLI